MFPLPLYSLPAAWGSGNIPHRSQASPWLYPDPGSPYWKTGIICLQILPAFHLQFPDTLRRIQISFRICRQKRFVRKLFQTPEHLSGSHVVGKQIHLTVRNPCSGKCKNTPQWLYAPSKSLVRYSVSVCPVKMGLSTPIWGTYNHLRSPD